MITYLEFVNTHPEFGRVTLVPELIVGVEELTSDHVDDPPCTSLRLSTGDFIEIAGAYEHLRDGWFAGWNHGGQFDQHHWAEGRCARCGAGQGDTATCYDTTVRAPWFTALGGTISIHKNAVLLSFAGVPPKNDTGPTAPIKDPHSVN